MTPEADRMKCPTKSLDVFEFKEEDSLNETMVKKSSTKVGYPCTKSGIDVLGDHVQRIKIGLLMGTNPTDVDCNLDAIGSPTVIKIEDYAVMSGLNCVHDGFGSYNQAADVTSDIITSGNAFAGMDMPVHLTSDADESISEKSSSTATSSDEPSLDSCYGWNLDNNGDNVRVGAVVVFYTDYLEYDGAHYLDSVVRFTQSFIEGRSTPIYGNGEIFHIHLEVEDIVKIESQWSAQSEAGTLSIYFISKDAVGDYITHDTSGIQELKCPVVDSNWYEKMDAIESLNVRYKAVWHVLLDTSMECRSVLPKGKSTIFTRSYLPNFNKPFQEIIYPKGDPDAVSISKRDVGLLLPDTFVNDTIIDFYIKYLKARQSVEERNKFHFFNSFFFRKLADMDKDPSSAFDGRAAFQRVRKWTRKVNLLEKDFIFIPVNYNYHWSLIVICYFGEVANYGDVDNKKSTRVPCILHMDSLRGHHLDLKDLMQSYLWEEWKERQKGTSDDMHSKFQNLKFIPLEVPQQPNSSDCGIFLLHYVELFLEEVPANFNIYKISPYTNFLQANWFPPSEASMKRTHIERLISDLVDTYSDDNTTFDSSSLQSSPDFGKISCVEFAVKPAKPSQVCHDNLLCEAGQGIEANLLPTLSKSTECMGVSGFGSKGLFDEASSSEARDVVTWGASGNSAPPLEFKIEAGVETNGPMELAEPVFQDLDGVKAEAAHIFHLSEDCRSEPVHDSLLLVASPSTSGDCTATESCSHIGIDNQVGNLFLQKEFRQEAYPVKASHSSPFVSGDKFGDSEPNQMLDSNDHTEASRESPYVLASDDPPVPSHQDALEFIPEADEQHPAKKMRMTPHGCQEEPLL